MIARVKLPTGVMYMALWQSGTGEWVPIGQNLAQSPDEARRMCREHMQQHLSVLSDHVVRGLRFAGDNLVRLHDEPGDADRIFISGMVRVLDDDGALQMPELHPGDDFLGGLADIKAGIADLDEHVLRDVAQVLGHAPARARAYLQQFANYLRFNPLALLSMLADAVEPDRFGDAALELVALYRELIARRPADTKDEPAGVVDLASVEHLGEETDS